MNEPRSSAVHAPWPVHRTRPPRLTRALSLGLSIALLAFFAAYPGLVLSDRIQLTQAVMPIALLGIVGGLIHGLGLQPRNELWAAIFSPWVTWPLMLASVAFLLLVSTN